MRMLPVITLMLACGGVHVRAAEDLYDRAVAATQPANAAEVSYVYTKFFVGGDKDNGEQLAVEHSGDRTRVTWRSRAKLAQPFAAELARADWHRLQKTLREVEMDQLPNRESAAWDGVEYHVSRVTPAGEHWLMINNPRRLPDAWLDHPPRPIDERYDALLDAFEAIKETAAFQLVPAPTWAGQKITVVWARVPEEAAALRLIDGEVYVWCVVRGTSAGLWRRVEDRADGRVDLTPMPKMEAFAGVTYEDHYRAPGHARYRDGVIQTKGIAGGTWWRRSGKDDDQITDATLQYPIVMPGEQVLIGVVGGELRAFHFNSGQFIPIKQSTHNFLPVLALDDDRVLIVRPDISPVRHGHWRDYRTLNTKTMQLSSKLHLDRTLWTQPLPPVDQLQKASVGGVWMAAPSEPNDDVSTTVGRFDLQTLRWRNSFSLDDVHFNTMQMVVDPQRQRILAIHAGVLLSIPIPDQMMHDRHE